MTHNLEYILTNNNNQHNLMFCVPDGVLHTAGPVTTVVTCDASDF